MLSSHTASRLGATLVAVAAPMLHDAIPGASSTRTSAAIAAGLMLSIRQAPRG